MASGSSSSNVYDILTRVNEAGEVSAKTLHTTDADKIRDLEARQAIKKQEQDFIALGEEEDDEDEGVIEPDFDDCYPPVWQRTILSSEELQEKMHSVRGLQGAYDAMTSMLPRNQGPFKVEEAWRRFAKTGGTFTDRKVWQKKFRERYNQKRRAVVAVLDEFDNTCQHVCGTLEIKSLEAAQGKAPKESDSKRKGKAPQTDPAKKVATTSAHGTPEAAVEETTSDDEPMAEELGSVVTHFVHDTQWPHIIITFDRKTRAGNIQKVSAYIFGSCVSFVEREDRSIALGLTQVYPPKMPKQGMKDEAALKYWRELQAKDLPEDVDELHWANQTNTLVQTRVEIDVRRRNVKWTGITTEELDQLTSHALADDPEMDRIDNVIGRLAWNARTLVIYHHVTAEREALFSNRLAHFQYFKNLCFLTLRFGDLWYYRSEHLRARKMAGDDIRKISDNTLTGLPFDDKFLWAYIQPPPWMVTEWAVCTRTDDKGVFQELRLVPLVWDSFSVPPVFPDTNSAFFVHILSHHRDRREIRRKMQEMKAALAAYRATARFLKDPKSGDQALAVVTWQSSVLTHFLDATKQETSKSLDTTMKPDAGTRVKIIALDKLPHRVDRIPMLGQVIELPSVRGDTVFVVRSNKLKFLKAESTYEVILQWKEDPVSVNRQINGLVQFQQAKRKTKGVDLPWVLFGGERVSRGGQGLYNTIRPNPVLSERYMKAVGTTPNAKQKLAARHPMLDSEDLTLVWGGPGNGKTRTTQLAVGALARAGEKILVVAATHSALNEGIEKLDKKDLVAVRFMGWHNRGQKQVTATAAPEELQQELDWDLVHQLAKQDSSINPSLLFWDQFLAWLGQITATTPPADTEKTQQAADAKKYLEEVEKLRKGEFVDENEKGTVQQSKNGLELALQQHFLAKVVQVIYVTCSASATEILFANFKPTVCVIEDAGQVTAGEFSPVAYHYGDSIIHLFENGDHMQNGPATVNTHSNEMCLIGRRSTFESSCEDPRFAGKVIKLDVQYRAHPDLADLTSQLFYEGRMKDDPSVKKEHPVDKIMEAWAKDNFGGAWSGNRNIALDCPDGESISSPRTQSSWQNEQEADRVTELVASLLKYRTKALPNAKITPESILVIVPYTAQKHLVLEKLSGSSMSVETAAVQEAATGTDLDAVSPSVLEHLLVKTITQAQGGEKPITIISMTMNVRYSIRDNQAGPLKIGWLAKGNLLNVQFSRAQRYQLTIGNWSGWQQALDSHRSVAYKHLKRKSRRYFIRLIRYFYERDLVLTEMDQVRLRFGKADAPTENTWASHRKKLGTLPDAIQIV